MLCTKMLLRKGLQLVMVISCNAYFITDLPLKHNIHKTPPNLPSPVSVNGKTILLMAKNMWKPLFNVPYSYHLGRFLIAVTILGINNLRKEVFNLSQTLRRQSIMMGR